MSDGLMGGGRAVFRIRDYSIYICSRFLWGLGQHIQTIAIAWLVYDLTRDPLALGFIGLAAFLPVLFLSLVTGPVADRYDRRMIIVLCSVAMALASASVIVVTATGYVHADRTWPRPGNGPRARCRGAEIISDRSSPRKRGSRSTHQRSRRVASDSRVRGNPRHRKNP